MNATIISRSQEQSSKILVVGSKHPQWLLTCTNYRIGNRYRPGHRVFSFPKNSDLALEFHVSSCLLSFLMF